MIINIDSIGDDLANAYEEGYEKGYQDALNELMKVIEIKLKKFRDSRG